MSDRDKILADLSAYLDGELAPQQVRRVEEAAKNDPAVAQELAALGRTRDLVRGLPRIRPGDDFVAGVLEKAERLRLVSAGPERAGGGFPVFRWLAAAAVLLVAVGVGVAVAVMLYTAPGPGTGVTGPIAQKPPPTPSPIAQGASDRTSGEPEGRLALRKDGLVGGAGNNEILYAPRGEFETALSDVAGVLASNGIQPAGTARQESEGRKQATILVYADPEQWQQLREGLTQVRTRRQGGAAGPDAGMKAEAGLAAEAGPAVARAPGAAAPLIRGAEPSSRGEGNTSGGLREQESPQRVAGLDGNPVLNIAQQNRATTQPAAQPANLYNSSQARWNVQPFLITLRSGPAPAGDSAGGASDAHPSGRPAATPAATRPATAPAAAPASAPATRSAK